VLGEFYEVVHGDIVNIYVDVWSMLESLFYTNNSRYLQTARSSIRTLITPELFNIAAHYRNWFTGRNGRRGMYTRVFFLYPGSPSALTTECPEYRCRQYSRFFNTNVDTSTLIGNCLEAAAALSRSIPGVYVVNTRDIDVDVAIQLISNDEKYRNDKNIVLTRSALSRQHLYYIPNGVVSTPAGVDTHIWNCDTSDAAYDAVVNSKNPQPTWRGVTSAQLPIHFAIRGRPDYGVQPVSGYGSVRTAKLLAQLVHRGTLVNSWYEYETLVSQLQNCSVFTREFVDEQRRLVYYNLKQTLYRYQHRLVNTGSITHLCLQIVDVPDINRVETLSMQYYFQNPIRTAELWYLPW
jgi:hypothetical protein